MRKTLLDHWIECRDKVYPDGIVDRQNRECQQSLYGWCFRFAFSRHGTFKVPGRQRLGVSGNQGNRGNARRAD